jgi:AraC-like DNA-binding protein
VPLEALLLQIQSHLDQPLTLAWLEQHSHYSRRALQYAFRRRFQLSPMAWIRQQRLARARQRLSCPQPGDSVASIARSCGYRHLSSFSKEFQRAFRCRPSALLRASRGAAELTLEGGGGARRRPAPG